MIGILSTLLQVYGFVLLGRALISWIPNLSPSVPVVPILVQLPEPVLAPIRKLVPPLGGVMDISLLIAYFATVLLGQLLRSM